MRVTRAYVVLAASAPVTNASVIVPGLIVFPLRVDRNYIRLRGQPMRGDETPGVRAARVRRQRASAPEDGRELATIIGQRNPKLADKQRHSETPKPPLTVAVQPLRNAFG